MHWSHFDILWCEDILGAIIWWSLVHLDRLGAFSETLDACFNCNMQMRSWAHRASSELMSPYSTGPESYVADMVKEKNLEWFPRLRAMSLQARNEAGTTTKYAHVFFAHYIYMLVNSLCSFHCLHAYRGRTKRRAQFDIRVGSNQVYGKISVFPKQAKQGQQP